MARDLHGHPSFNVTIGAFERFQPCHLVRGVKAEHVRRRLFVEEGREPTDNFPLIAAFFDALEKLLLACGGDVRLWLCHRSGSIAGKELVSIDQFPISTPESPSDKSILWRRSIVRHLENLQRKGGFKGFNQKSVSVIISATDPRKQNAAHKAA
jgi:hypothetical protein